MEETDFYGAAFLVSRFHKISEYNLNFQTMKIMKKWLKTGGRLYICDSISEIIKGGVEKQFAKGWDKGNDQWGIDSR